ncbi:MAG: hypothetical protein PHX70_10355 [Clostridium sp.]|nr:hypothetical protein [Clostridium sp.]
MRVDYPWIYIDSNKKTWKFYTNSNKNLVYKIMCEQGKWIKEKIIDNNVGNFAIYIEEDETIHIIYVNSKKELKYCTFKDSKWIGKMLYCIEDAKFDVQNLKVTIINGEMHFFYLLVSIDGSGHGVLTHCKWDGKETKVSTIQDIVMSEKAEEYYEVQVNEVNCIKVFFISDSGDEIALNYSSYENNLWTLPKRIYGLCGESIFFKVLNDFDSVNILNMTKNGSNYSFDYVEFQNNQNIKSFKVYESTNIIGEPILLSIKNVIIISWKEDSGVFYSYYSNEKWSPALKYSLSEDKYTLIYNFINRGNQDELNKIQRIYGTDEPDLHILKFDEIFEKDKKPSEDKNDDNDLIINSEDEHIKKIKEELFRINFENNILKKKIMSINMQLQKKQRIEEQYKSELEKISDQKKRVEENFNIFIEVKQNVQKKLDNANKKLTDQKLVEAKLQNKLKEKEKNNEILKKKIEIEISEKNKIKEELLLEKNQSFVNKIFRRKSDNS